MQPGGAGTNSPGTPNAGAEPGNVGEALGGYFGALNDLAANNRNYAEDSLGFEFSGMASRWGLPSSGEAIFGYPGAFLSYPAGSVTVTSYIFSDPLQTTFYSAPTAWDQNPGGLDVETQTFANGTVQWRSSTSNPWTTIPRGENLGQAIQVVRRDPGA
jgi:hypothetical protein